MKLVTFEYQDSISIGALIQIEDAGLILDLHKADPRLPADMIEFLKAGEAALSIAGDLIKSPPADAVIPETGVTLLAPIPRPGKIICLGHNYHDHSAKAEGELPEYPTFFSKYSTSVTGPGQSIILPRNSREVDNEAELACIIGKHALHVTEEKAEDYIAGYTIFNDVSARDYVKRSSQWMLGKTFDTFGPMGPTLVTADEIPEPGSLELILTVNDQKIQHGNTGNFIFSIPFLIASLSEVMTLEPGDLISTGTPGRLGDFRDNPVFMKPGDEVRIRIEKIGVLSNTYTADSR
jgi:acylpyruvate hydrolase